MAGNLSGGTTNLTNLVVETLGPASGGGGGSSTSVGQILTSNISSRNSILAQDIWASTVSTPSALASRVSSSISVLAAAVWTSGLSVGGGGTLIPAISSTSSLVGVWVVQGSASSFTRVTWAAVQPGDQILTTVFPDAAQSSMSSGLVPWSHCTVAGFIELRLSNVSTLVQNQSSKSFYFTRISAF